MHRVAWPIEQRDHTQLDGLMRLPKGVSSSRSSGVDPRSLDLRKCAATARAYSGTGRHGCTTRTITRTRTRVVGTKFKQDRLAL